MRVLEIAIMLPVLRDEDLILVASKLIIIQQENVNILLSGFRIHEHF